MDGMLIECVTMTGVLTEGKVAVPADVSMAAVCTAPRSSLFTAGPSKQKPGQQVSKKQFKWCNHYIFEC